MASESSLLAANMSPEKDLGNSRTLNKPSQVSTSSTQQFQQQASPVSVKSKARIEIPIAIVSSEGDFGPGLPLRPRDVGEVPFPLSASGKQTSPPCIADFRNRSAEPTSQTQSQRGDELLTAGLSPGRIDRQEPSKYAPSLSPATPAGPLGETSPRMDPPGLPAEDLETRSGKEHQHPEQKVDAIDEDKHLIGGIERNGVLPESAPFHHDSKSSPLSIIGVQGSLSDNESSKPSDRTDSPLPPYNPPIFPSDAKKATSASVTTPIPSEGTYAEPHQGTPGHNGQEGSEKISEKAATADLPSTREAPAMQGGNPKRASSAESRPRGGAPGGSLSRPVLEAASASDEALQGQCAADVTLNVRVQEAELRVGGERSLQAREQGRMQKDALGLEAQNARRRGVQQQPAASPLAQSQSQGWGNGRAANEGWQGSPGGQGYQQGLMHAPHQGETPPSGVQLRRQQSGGHGRGSWQPPGRYSPQGLGKGAGFQGPMRHNAPMGTSPPGTSNPRRNGMVDGGGGRPRGQSRSPESPLNWGKPVSPNLEELNPGPSVAMSLPPVPQPLPPTLAGGGATHLTIDWQESPLCQFYFLDMALSVDRGARETDSPRAGRGPDGDRLVGESLDWRPVYSGKDSKCQVRHRGKSCMCMIDSCVCQWPSMAQVFMAAYDGAVDALCIEA